jgi:hypothetical protein
MEPTEQKKRKKPHDATRDQTEDKRLKLSLDGGEEVYSPGGERKRKRDDGDIKQSQSKLSNDSFPTYDKDSLNGTDDLDKVVESNDIIPMVNPNLLAETSTTNPFDAQTEYQFYFPNVLAICSEYYDTDTELYTGTDLDMCFDTIPSSNLRIPVPSSSVSVSSSCVPVLSTLPASELSTLPASELSTLPASELSTLPASELTPESNLLLVPVLSLEPSSIPVSGSNECVLESETVIQMPFDELSNKEVGKENTTNQVQTTNTSAVDSTNNQDEQPTRTMDTTQTQSQIDQDDKQQTCTIETTQTQSEIDQDDKQQTCTMDTTQTQSQEENVQSECAFNYEQRDFTFDPEQTDYKISKLRTLRKPTTRSKNKKAIPYSVIEKHLKGGITSTKNHPAPNIFTDKEYIDRKYPLRTDYMKTWWPEFMEMMYKPVLQGRHWKSEWIDQLVDAGKRLTFEQLNMSNMTNLSKILYEILGSFYPHPTSWTREPFNYICNQIKKKKNIIMATSTIKKELIEDEESTDSTCRRVSKKRRDDDSFACTPPLKKRTLEKNDSSNKHDEKPVQERNDEDVSSEYDDESIPDHENTSPYDFVRQSSILSLQDTTRKQLQKCFSLVDDEMQNGALTNLVNDFAHEGLSCGCLENIAIHDRTWIEFCDDKLQYLSIQTRRNLRNVLCISYFVRTFMSRSGIVAYNCHMSILRAILDSDFKIHELLLLGEEDTTKWTTLKSNLIRLDVNYGHIYQFRCWTLLHLEQIRSEWAHMRLITERAI